MTVSQIRWITLTVSFFVLSFGGLAALSLGNFLPTFSCFYVESRSGTCFLWVLQHLLDHGYWEAYKSLGKYLLYFSLLVIVIGRAWCGWICPLGFFQDVLDLIRRKLHLGYISFPEELRAQLSCVKWIFLFIALLIPLWVSFPFFGKSIAMDLRQPFCQLCPGKYILPFILGDTVDVAVNFKSTTTIIMSVLGLIFSGVVIFGALLKRRFWCPYCPMGLFLSFYKKISFIKLKKDCQKCTMCGICYNVCPMEIKDLLTERKNEDVTFTDCTLCLRCVEYCPEDETLRATFFGRTIYKSSSKGFFSRQHITSGFPEEKHQVVSEPYQ
ncbi:MAG: 4Fe-4S binding protein [Deltaproteobacteria bacterium]|nr:4Fe-4S binding protein [Deltaproteobacteria bacterium]